MSAMVEVKLVNIYLVTWKYGDNSAHGVCRAFLTEVAAQDCRHLMERHCAEKEFAIAVTQLMEIEQL